MANPPVLTSPEIRDIEGRLEFVRRHVNNGGLRFAYEARLICAYKQAGILGIIEEVSTILAELPLKEPQ